MDRGPEPERAGRMSLASRCFEACDGRPVAALALAVRITRLELIATGRVEPLPDERIPDTVWRRLEEQTAT